MFIKQDLRRITQSLMYFQILPGEKPKTSTYQRKVVDLLEVLQISVKPLNLIVDSVIR